MPELPEVETVRRGLQQSVIGRIACTVAVTGRRTVRRQDPAEFVALLSGRRLAAAERRGKYLLIRLDEVATLVVHLRMSGQLRHLPADAPLELHTHVVIGLEDGTELRFVDPRTFGELFVTEDHDGAGLPLELFSVGLDPLLDGVSRQRLVKLLAKRRMPLKAFLLDQRFIAGIGNIYADEICFVARLRPTRRTESLTAREIGRLARAIKTVLDEAVELGGSSLNDARYRDLFGDLGRFQIRHAVYARTGAPCPRCATPIERMTVAGRSAHFCPRCQA